MLTVNEYFEGHIKSIAFTSDSQPATVGVMAPGEYVFSTTDREKMTVISGALTVKLPGEATFTTYKTGENFIVAADSNFDVEVENETAYLCLYG